jgi:hypothetical protein
MNIQIQKKLIIALARVENGFVVVIDAKHGAKSSIKIEMNMKVIPKINHKLFHNCSETIISPLKIIFYRIKLNFSQTFGLEFPNFCLSCVFVFSFYKENIFLPYFYIVQIFLQKSVIKMPPHLLPWN